MTPINFINKVEPLIRKENEKRGNPLFNSVVIAQSALETGWGNSGLMMKANAIFGIKATTDWKGKVYSSQTNEVYNGNYVNITANFRAYDSLEESVKDYFNLICNLDRYKNALFQTSPRRCIEEIKKGGYATSPTYVISVMSIINDFKLVQYDNISSNKENLPRYTKGKNYKVLVDLNVRIKAGIDQKQKLKKQLTYDGMIHSYDQTLAVLKPGTIVTVLDSVILNKNEVWLQIPSGWIAGYYKGEYYVK